MPGFRLKSTARADLKGIARYMEQTWGRDQRNGYLTKMDSAFHRLADNIDLGIACDPIRSGYRVFPVGSHLIFYRQGAGGDIEIIRILHKHMDVSFRL